MDGKFVVYFVRSRKERRKKKKERRGEEKSRPSRDLKQQSNRGRHFVSAYRSSS